MRQETETWRTDWGRDSSTKKMSKQGRRREQRQTRRSRIFCRDPWGISSFGFSNEGAERNPSHARSRRAHV